MRFQLRNAASSLARIGLRIWKGSRMALVICKAIFWGLMKTSRLAIAIYTQIEWHPMFF